MIKEYQAFMEAFQQGKMIKQAVGAKNFQMLGNSLAAFLTAAMVISQGFGYYVPIDQSTLNQACAGVGSIWFVINTVITVVSSNKVGIKPKVTK